MKKTILIFPCGSEIGLEIHKSLAYSTHFALIGGSSVDDHGRFVYQNYLGDLPFVTDPGFTAKINQVIRDHHVDFVIPAHDNVLLKLAQARAAGELDCPVITSPLPTCEIATSKAQTYRFFDGVVPTPRVYDTVTAADLPVFLKPDVGNGSRGTHLAKTLAEVELYRAQDPSLLALEYLPGKEYTVDCFTDKTGSLRFCSGRERRRIQNGISVNTVTVDDPRFRELAAKINAATPFRGAWFFQVKESAAADLVLMEIAPRIAGAMGLERAKGANLVLLSLFDALGYEVDVFENSYNIVIDRALENRYEHNITYRHVYLDLDDLVIFERKVNPQVMAFVFQCLNQDIKVHLITRHKDDLTATLKKYRLDGIFDTPIWVKGDDEKYLYIKEKDAIYIDDSFAERKKIHDRCHIPTFDAHMLESLVERFN